MKIEYLEKAKVGQDLIAKQHKIQKQIEALKTCNCIKIFESKGNNENPSQFDFEKGNPFYFECAIFIEKYKLFLMETLDKLKIEFDNL